MAVPRNLTRGVALLFRQSNIYVGGPRRLYARLVHRNPIKILTVEEAAKISKPSLQFQDESDPPRRTSSGHRHSKEQLNSVETFEGGPNHNNKSKGKPSYEVSRGTSRVLDNKPASEQTGSKDTKSRSHVKTPESCIISITTKKGGKVDLPVFTDKTTCERKLA